MSIADFIKSFFDERVEKIKGHAFYLVSGLVY